MFGPIRLLVITSVLKVTVLGDVSKISDVKACTEFCSASGNVGTFQNGHCTCENVDKDSLNVLREYRQVEYIDPNLYSKDLTDEGRTARCTLGSARKRLGHHDAERVVKYFINDGPATGHAYFVGASTQNDNVKEECENKKNPLANLYVNADESGNPVPDHQGLELTGENYYQPGYSDAIVGAYNPYDPIYLLPQEVPVASVAMNPYEHVISSTYGPAVGSNNYILNRPIDTVQTTPRDRLLAAKSARRTARPRLSTLKQMSNTLLGLVKEPVHQGLLGARSFFHNLLTPEPTVYSPQYASDFNMIGRSNVESIIPEADPVVGAENENSQDPEVNLETGSQNNTEKSSERKKSTNSVPFTPRANIPAGTFQNIPYNQQYFMPIYPPQQNPAFFNSMARAYILQPVQIMPQATRSASPSEITGSSKQQDSSNCENNFSISEDNNTELANATTQKPEGETNSNATDSLITKRDSNKQKH